MAGLAGSPPFGIGTTRATFQSEGNFPLLRDLLNSLVRLLAMNGAVDLSILAETPSAPVDLLVSKEVIKDSILSSVHRNSSGKLDGSRLSRLSRLLTVLVSLFDVVVFATSLASQAQRGSLSV